MNNKPVVENLYFFKYSAVDRNKKSVNDYFIASSLDDCKIFLEKLGYTSINLNPLKPGEPKPNINVRLDTDSVSIEFGKLYSYLKNNVNLLDAIINMANFTKNNNRNIYYRMAYNVYKGDSFSNAMKKLGDIIPTFIVDQISIGELSNNIPSKVTLIVKKYAKEEKKGFFAGLFSKNEDKKNIIEGENANKENDNLKGIAVHKKAVDKSKLYPFLYKAVLENGKKVKGYFDAESIDDCRKFLEIQGYTDIKVEPRKDYDVEIMIGNKVKLADLAFDLTQLSTYIKAGIPLVDGVTILAKQAKRPASKKAYEKLVYNLLKGDSLSSAMEKQAKVFPQLLINMIRSAEMTGDLSSILDDMAEYYEDMEQTKKAMKSAMTYPLLVLVLAVCVLAFMLLELVPQFVSLYESNGAILPGITLFIIGASNFLQSNYLYIIIIFFIFVVLFYLCYKNIVSFKKFFQTVTMRLPGFGKIIIYNEVYNFTKTFSSLINHGVFITDSMEILSNITSNEVYKDIISKTLSNLAKGDTISTSFRGEWAFPTVAYHMLVTGENTGQLGLMMEKVSEHYQQLHKSMVDQLKSLIEPIMILLVAGIVGVILLSIITPMFDIYSQIQ